jgi:hypothetical protein
MTTNPINQTPYLRTSRNFPSDPQPLSVEINRSYLDIAEKINVRTIGIFPTLKPAITGESWFLTNNVKQQTLRQVFKFTGSSSFNHNLNFANISFFTVIRGIGFDGSNYFPIPYVAATITNGNVGVFVSPTGIIFSTDVASPTIVSGFILLEWLSKV